MNTRFPRSLAIQILALLTCSALRADVTARYKTEITTNPALSALSAGATQGIQAALPQETGFRLKNGKAVSSMYGFTTILDYSSKEMTIVDASMMRYAKMTYQQFLDEAAKAVPETPANAKTAWASMKTSVSDARLTGRTAAIQGVEAEEREIVIALQGPAIPAPGTDPAPAGPTVRIVLQFWTAKPAEALRVPAIHELAGYSAYWNATMGPLVSIDKMMNQLPGFASAFDPFMKALRNGGALLRTHMELYMPAMAAMLQKLSAAGNAAPAMDPAAPLFQANQELLELSTAPIPDSAIQVPDGYEQAPPLELIQAYLAKAKGAAQK
jgi:hypothetical protein